MASIAKERGAAIVVTKSSVIYNQPQLDATEETLERLNAAFPEVSLPFDTLNAPLVGPEEGAVDDSNPDGGASGG